MVPTTINFRGEFISMRYNSRTYMLTTKYKGDWYFSKTNKIIKFYGFTRDIHKLPKFISNMTYILKYMR